jgi:transcriptional regulator with XRE-family HTH domain
LELCVVKERDVVDLHVGARLRYRRMSIGMSQEALAEAVGLRFQQIQKYEKGQNRIGAGRLFRLAAALKVPISFFFEDLSQEAGENLAAAREPLDFLNRPEGMELARHFLRIEDPTTRRKLVELVRSMAGDEDPAKRGGGAG